MLSLSRTTFLDGEDRRRFYRAQRTPAAKVKARVVRCVAAGERKTRKVEILIEKNGGAEIVDPKSAVGGGVKDFYGEDRATEDHHITPWSLSVARFRSHRLYSVIHEPRFHRRQTTFLSVRAGRYALSV